VQPPCEHLALIRGRLVKIAEVWFFDCFGDKFAFVVSSRFRMPVYVLFHYSVMYQH